MLNEIKGTRQIEGEPSRRWFNDKDMDLMVWIGDSGAVAGFQICYEKCTGEHALTWKHDKGFSHHRVDGGEERPGRFKGIAILLPDGIIDFKAVAQSFKERSGNIDPTVSRFIYETLLTGER